MKPSISTIAACLASCVFLVSTTNCLAGPGANSGNQYRADTGASIPFTGTIPAGVGVYFEANVFSPEGRTVRMEVELRKLPATFTGAANYVSSYRAAGTRARTATATSLTAGNYGWRYRVVDSAGFSSNWVAEGSPDFVVQGASTTVPTVTAQPATLVSSNSARLWGRITSDGGASILERRVEWGISGNWSNSAANVTVSGNDFSYDLSGLTPNTTYQYRAWARNSVGWAYSATRYFTTASAIGSPTVTITTPSSNQTVGNATTSFAFSGSASAPGSAVSSVQWRVNSGNWNTATGTTSWSFTVSNLIVGQNIVNVRSRNTQGTFSSTASRTITRESTVDPETMITSVNDGNPIPPSNSQQPITIKGSDFKNGCTLTFTDPMGDTYQSVVNRLTFNSSSQLTYQFNNASDSGTWTVRVNNPDGNQSNIFSFTVTTGSSGDTPLFQLPFACGETWYGYTHSGESHTGLNLYALDINKRPPNTEDPRGLGEPVLASASGNVSRLNRLDPTIPNGIFIEIDHGGGWRTVYLHLQEESIPSSIEGVGSPILGGQVIGRLGNTGLSTAAHLHYDQRLVIGNDYQTQPIKFNGQPVQYVMIGEPPNKVAIISANCAGLPSITITTPSSNQTVGNATTSFAFSGSASAPGSAVSSVQWRVNSGNWNTATGTTSWSFTVSNLIVGQNVVEVRSRNTLGTDSSLASRTITREAAGLLPAPSLTGPGNGATGVSTTPTFSWTSVSGANGYWLTVATSAADLPTDPAATSCTPCVSTGISGTTTSTSHTANNSSGFSGTTRALQAGTTYYWRVQGFNNSTDGNFSVIRSFTTAPAVEPPPGDIQIIQDFIPLHRSNRPGTPMEVAAITIHDTANTSAGANAAAHAIYVKGDDAAARQVSWHLTVDDIEIFQHLPLNEIGWHAGSAACNGDSIGIEICENSDGNRAIAEENAAWLTAKLLIDFNLSIEDVQQHHDCSGKNCPNVLRGRSGGWDEFLAKVASHMDAPSDPTKIISLSGNLGFGEVEVGTTATKVLAISNTGTSALTVSSINYPNRFSGDWSGGTIPAGGSQPITVTFAPATAVTYSGSLTVNSDATGGTDTISLSGTGISAPTRIIALSGNLNFEEVQVGSTGTRVLTISNMGTSSLTVNSINYPNRFSGNWAGGTISAGGSRMVTVTFTPTATISYSGGVIIDSDATSGSETISISGTGTSVSTRIIALSGDLNFAEVQVGSTGTRVLTISNTGNSPLHVSSLDYPAGFGGNWSGGAIPAGGSQSVTVTFNPSATVTYSGNVTVVSDATSGSGTTSISGTGASTPTKVIALSGDLDFGEVQVGTTAMSDLTISNLGTTTLAVSAISFPSAFSGDWSSGTIQAGDSQVVTVTFAPLTLIPYGGEVMATSDATEGNGTISISGAGVPVALTCLTGLGNQYGDVVVELEDGAEGVEITFWILYESPPVSDPPPLPDSSEWPPPSEWVIDQGSARTNQAGKAYFCVEALNGANEWTFVTAPGYRSTGSHWSLAGSGRWEIRETMSPQLTPVFHQWAAPIGNEALRGPGDTPLNDNVSNLMKYALGIAANERAPSELLRARTDTNGRFIVQFERHGGREDVIYEIQSSSDLEAWITIAQAVGTEAFEGTGVEVSETAHPVNATLRTVTLDESPESLGDIRRFHRLVVTLIE